MKILQLVQKPQRRGAEIFAYQLSQELRRQGHEVRLVYLYPHQGDNALPLGQADHLLGGRENHPLEKLPGFHPGLLSEISRLIYQFRPDVVQVNGTRTVKYGAFARRWSRQSDWVLIYRNIGNPQDWVRGRRRRWFYDRWVMPGIDGVVGVSQATLDNLTEFYCFSIPTLNIPRGIDPGALQPALPREAIRRQLGLSPQAPLLLFVGSLTPEKRLDRLLRVTHQVRRQLPQLRLWLVGEGPLRPEVQHQAQVLGLAEAVHFLGVQAEVATYINAADLLLLTSDTEGVPGVILEAGLLGIPAVATRVGGVPEALIDGKTGLLADPNNESDLTQAILILLQQPEKRQRLGEAARQRVRRNYTIDNIAQQYIGFYRQVLKIQKKVKSPEALNWY